MEINPTPFPVVKSDHVKPKSTRKISEAPKINLREKRVFGTARNPNLPSKSAPEKPIKGKPSSALLKKSVKPIQATQSPLPGPPEAKNASEKTPARTKKKSVCFQENQKLSGDGKAGEPRTPAKSPAAAVPEKPRHSATPYRTAEKCSKCRFDKLETSAYWLSQIKLAESVGKHSVSAAFFGLAFESKAEPIRNIRVALKKYTGRHEYLNEEQEWKKLSVSYGLVKEESYVNKEASVVDNQENGDLVDEIGDKDEVLMNENGEEKR
ncbi:hypothetical protein ABFS82_04G191700 [Erythranthe guttata]|uniref:uncharacterized protein LOC105949037 n=1 Tax=Erythranthe guttata TaxID=4155 RepID=UPI00064DC303|nr:PREDICTED: uncharacterized protein LOC105949037 [Erythranthe guttata]|eukprot:XP_012827759.1 PREDICTED: uncharacterized protein LOC105949037 [Erythranthe guttata]